jgi:hypothetical protein
MPEFEENLKKIESLLKIARIYDEYSTCEDLYCFLGIGNRKAAPDEIETIIGVKKKYFQGQQNNAKWGKLAVEFVSAQRAINSILLDNRSDYDKYLIDCKAKELRKHFILLTKYDDELSTNDEQILIGEGKELGLSEREIIEFINRWLVEDGVQRVTAPFSDSGSSSIPFDVLLNKTYYEILGISEDAEYAQIKAIHDKEYSKYNETRDKVKANARWVLVSEAWECLKDPVKRREYDEKLKQPKTPVPKGVPVLIVERKNDDDYTFKDVRRGDTITEKIVIKNTEGGLLQGTITSDVPWIEPERNKILEKHEQDLTINILTSKIPSKSSKSEGTLSIATNGGTHAIPFKVYLESYEFELKRFQQGYVPLSAAIAGFLFSFVPGVKIWEVIRITPIFFAIWYAIQDLIKKNVTDVFLAIKEVGKAALIGWIGGWIIFSIIKKLTLDMPHFTSFFMGAYFIGFPSYLLNKQVFELLTKKGIDILKYSSEMFYASSVGVVVLTIIIHALISNARIVPPPPPPPPISNIQITRSVIAERIDTNNQPEGIATVFHESPSRAMNLVYYADYKNAVANQTKMEVKWYRENNLISDECDYTLPDSSGWYKCALNYGFTKGDYEARLFADGKEVNRTSFKIVASAIQPSELKIYRAEIATGVDRYNEPVGEASIFYEEPSGNKSYFYCAYFGDAVPNQTKVKVQCYRDGSFLNVGCDSTLGSSAGWYNCQLGSNFSAGSYEAQLFANGKEVNRTNFTINTPPVPPVADWGKAGKESTYEDK